MLKRFLLTSVVAVAIAAAAACARNAPTSPSATGSVVPAGPGGGSVGILGKGGKGNGAPSGAHYTLNIIGVDHDKTADMSNIGHRIFVDLFGPTKILLYQRDDYIVLDANGTDGEASFGLPNPDVNGDGTTDYSVFARALGTPGGSADMSTCAWDPELSATVCSLAVLSLSRSNGKVDKFQNVSKELLYVYYDIDGDGTVDRVALFDNALEDYFWQYDNNGLRVAQLRFYQCSTEVPSGTNWNDPLIWTDCFD